VEVDLWVASSDDDADLFVYLEDFDPGKQKAKYVTEGQMRASHRKELAVPRGDHRAAAHLPGTNSRSKTNMELRKLQNAGVAPKRSWERQWATRGRRRIYQVNF